MGAVEIDGSFKKPGAIPFKWETRPGVPKSDHQSDHDASQSLPSTPHHLTPPPRTHSLRTPSRSHSVLRWYDHDQDQDQDQDQDLKSTPDPPLLTRPESASAAGCLLSPRLSWKWGWRKLAAAAKSKRKHEPDHGTNLAARWSISTRKSLSSLRGSPSSSSFSSSHGSSP